MATKKKAAVFPESIYVRREVDGHSSYLIASEVIGDVSLDDGSRAVARYQLVEIGEVVESREFIS